jgi:hypothetical protein
MFENRLYYILDVSEDSKIDFDEILQKDLDSLRKSPDGSRCLIKIEGSPKGFLSTINSLSGPFTHSQIRNKLKNKNWD